MPSLKDLKSRKASVQSTKKITSAMKMISAAKLRKAQERVAQARPFASKMGETLAALTTRKTTFETPPKLLVGAGKEKQHWVFVIASNRGLCGSFNGNVGRRATAHIEALVEKGRNIKIFCVGKRAYDLIRGSPFKDHIVGHVFAVDKPSYAFAKHLIGKMLEEFQEDKVDVCTVIYNRFVTAISQEVSAHQLIPFAPLAVRSAISSSSHPEGGGGLSG